MSQKWIIPIFVFFLLLFSITFYFTTALKIESTWALSNEKYVVIPNKIWKINFSEKIDPSYIKEPYIIVTNEKGEKVNISLSENDGQKSISVSPPINGYQANMEYTLYIDRKLQSANGRELRKNVRISFAVKKTLPVVHSKKELNEHFLKILKVQKEAITLNKGIVMESSKDAGASEKSADSVKEYSETNNQVAGIDEADIIKTDGRQIYQVMDGKVNIIKAIPSNKMEVLSTISFDQSFYANELFLHHDKLIVIGNGSKMLEKEKVSFDQTIPMFNATKVLIYDIKNPSEPKILREIEVEGQTIQSRKKDGIIYLISNYYPDFWTLEKDKDADLRPKYSDSIKGSNLQTIPYNKIQYLPQSHEANYTIITTINLEDPRQNIGLTTYLGSGQQIYMSEKNLYIAVSNYPLVQTFRESVDSANTSIYKFSVNGTRVDFRNSTEVSGRVLNQFSMDEYHGYFRVATTEGDTWNEKESSANHLFILDENLIEVGKLNDLAKGERIYSTRFMGDRIYIVTFKETDPLFVIDGKDPRNPTVLGELKIPGFSNYLHPLDENHLIGFGYDTKVLSDKGSINGQRVVTGGIKISFFDVTNMKKPIEKFHEIIGDRGTYSALNYDHKALLIDKKRQLFTFPISVYQDIEGNEFEQKFDFQGGYVYHLDIDNGFTLLHKISHMNQAAPYEEWENSIQRFLYIGDNLYAISPKKITSYQLKDFVQNGEVKF